MGLGDRRVGLCAADRAAAQTLARRDSGPAAAAEHDRPRAAARRHRRADLSVGSLDLHPGPLAAATCAGWVDWVSLRWPSSWSTGRSTRGRTPSGTSSSSRRSSCRPTSSAGWCGGWRSRRCCSRSARSSSPGRRCGPSGTGSPGICTTSSRTRSVPWSCRPPRRRTWCAPTLTGPSSCSRGVADTGRRALTETGRLLHVIRDETDELGLAPTPGLAPTRAGTTPGLADLRGLGRTQASTSSCTRTRRDPVAGRHRCVGLSDRGGGAHERAALRDRRGGSDGDVQRLRRRCPGLEPQRRASARVRGGAGSGLGLRGMAERVALLGGTLTHGMTGDRFELAAVLPGDPP